MKEDLNEVKKQVEELKTEVNENKPSFAMEIMHDLKKDLKLASTIAIVEGIALVLMISLYIIK